MIDRRLIEFSLGPVGGFGQKSVEVQGPCEHRQPSIGRARPVGSWTIPIQLDAVLVGVAKVKSLTHAVVTGSVERNGRLQKPPERISERRE